MIGTDPIQVQLLLKLRAYEELVIDGRIGVDGIVAASPIGGPMVRRPKFRMVLLAFFSLVLPTPAYPDGRRIPRNQLPVPVRKTADEQSVGATIRAFTTDVDSGHREYKVELTIMGHSKNVTIAPDGRVIEIEEQVDAAVLPVNVVSALRNAAREGQITKIESVTKNGVIVAYEAHVRSTRGRAQIRVGPGGESLSHEK